MKNKELGLQVQDDFIISRMKSNISLENAVMNLNIECGSFQAALSIWYKLKSSPDMNMKPDSTTYTHMLKLCAVTEDLTLGKQLHFEIGANIVECTPDLSMGLINMYLMCGHVKTATSIWDSLAFSSKPQRELYVLLLSSCAFKQELEFGKSLMVNMLSKRVEADAKLQASIFSFFKECGILEPEKLTDILTELYNKISDGGGSEASEFGTWNPILEGL